MKVISFITFIILFIEARSQSVTVIDRSLREPLENVVIRDNSSNVAKTNSQGRADISLLSKKDSVQVYLYGYFPRKIVLNQATLSGPVELSAKTVNLDEIVFSANRTEEKKTDVPFTVEVIRQKDIEFGNQPTSGDVLANTGNIALQKSQAGGGSPNIRGFEASRVLIVLDGVRMNNAIYRSGHLQDVMTLDAQMLDRTEVIFGPSSTIYGSDALGGVMHFYTKSPQFGTREKMLVKTNTMFRYASVNREMTGHLDFNVGWKNFAWLTNVTLSEFGDTRSGRVTLPGYSNNWDRNFYAERREQLVNKGTANAPNIQGSGIQIDTMIPNADKNVLVGSGYKQTDIMQRFRFRTGENLTHDLSFQMSLNPYLPRYDRLAGDFSSGKLRWAENHYVQNRMMGAYTLNFSRKTPVSDNIRFIAAYQKIEQDRITRRFGNDNRITQMEDVGVFSANLDVTKRIVEKHELRYGLETTFNDVRSTAKTLDIRKDSTFRADTRYAPASIMNTYAAYLSYGYEMSEHFVINAGFRLTHAEVKCNFTDTLPFRFPFTVAMQKSNAVTGSLGFTWKAENNYKFSLLANSGFRTPNVDDMSKLFESGAVLIVANPSIKPEYAYNFEMGASKIFRRKYKFDVTGFYSIVQNYLTLRDFKYNGQDSIDYNGTKLKVQAMQNTDRAYVYGVSSACQLDFNSNISFKSTVNFVYGRYQDVRRDTIVPLDHIAPVFGMTGIVYKEKRTDAEFFVRYSGRKNLSDYSPSGEDNLQYATPNGMPGWFTLNLRAAYNFTKNLRLNAACENITDHRYRVFASGINAPGRNFIVSLRYKF